MIKKSIAIPSIGKRSTNKNSSVRLGCGYGLQNVTNKKRSSHVWLWSILVILLIGLAWRALAEAPEAWQNHHYTVVRIVDGDTFVASDGNIKFRVRIVGMDAPESAQSYGKVAKAALDKLLTGQVVTLQTVGSGLDQYGRVLGIVFVNKKDVAEDMIKQGLATYYRPHCTDYPADANKYNYDPRLYVQDEAQARSQKLGIWSDKSFILPCQFRKAE